MADLGGGLLEPGGGQREELKTQFMTREGTYHLMALAEYTRPNRLGYNNQPANGSVPVKVSHSLLFSLSSQLVTSRRFLLFTLSLKRIPVRLSPSTTGGSCSSTPTEASERPLT